MKKNASIYHADLHLSLFIRCLMVLVGFLTSASMHLDAQQVFVKVNGSQTVVYRSMDSVLINLADGDTIYLPGGTYQTGTMVFNKRVCVYGAGHYPDSAAGTGRTILNGDIRITGAASGSLFQGFYVSGNVALGTDAQNSDVQNLVFSRCSMGDVILAANDNYVSKATNILFRENVVRINFNGRYAKDILIENNIISGGIYNLNGSALIANNLIFGNGYSLYYCSSILFENNIFYQGSGFQSGSGSNTFRNNVFRLANPLLGSDIGEQNLFSVTNLFVQGGSNFSYTDNYTLSPDSPARTAGKSGGQCGIFGGPRPYKPAALPINPHIRSKSIADNTNAAGQLQVQATVVAQGN